jgi:alpha-glucosidase
MEFMAEVKSLVALRRTHKALIHGGLRWVAVENDYVAYLRESKTESILVLISRSDVSANLDLSKFGYEISKTLYGQAAKGSSLSIKSKAATYGIWQLKRMTA